MANGITLVNMACYMYAAVNLDNLGVVNVLAAAGGAWGLIQLFYNLGLSAGSVKMVPCLIS
jgi:hypothetical protein